MPLLFIGTRTKKQPPWFPPDRLENVRHDAPGDANMVVYDANGLPVWGRVVPGATKRWEHKLSDWVWVPND